jgi:molecular chaperone DnaK
MAGAVLGTLDFMPPEQRRDATQTDNRSDLWSLAATLYQLVSGDPPRVIDLDEVPQELRTTLSKALKTKPDARYQTAGEFKDALRATARTASQPIQEPAAELGAGECPKCHTKNEASRKFCRNGTCGGPLRVKCLACEREIPVWDQVCGDCGGKQADLIGSILADFAVLREQADDHRREYRFEDALQIARSLVSVEDERLAEHVPWAEEFVTATEAAWERERESAAANFVEARTHRDAFDYASAIHAVESVPEAMRTSEMSGYLQHLERDRAESEELIKTISDRVKRRDLKGLLGQVERAVELRGDRTDLQKMAGQLRERKAKRQQQRDEAKRQRDEACAEAKRLFDTGDAKGALAMIQSVPAEDLRSSDEQLRSQLERIVAAEDKLTALVKESKADGVLDPDEVVDMYLAASSYLELNPKHAKISGMLDQLKGRLIKEGFLEGVSKQLIAKLPASVLRQAALPDVMLQSGQTVGIDLGTTFSSVAWLGNDGRVQVLENADERVITPSVVLLSDDGRVVVGPSNERIAVEDPSNVVEVIKREMGNADFHVVYQNKKLTPEFISALIIKKMKQDAEKHIGEIANAVVTVPYYFNDVRRKATQDAGRIAGLNIIDIINEPTAATLAYAWERGELGNTALAQTEKTILVYNLGGGTFDVAVVRYTPTNFKVLAKDGDVMLGGLDWSRRILDHVSEQFAKKHGEDPREDPETVQILSQECEKAKRELSTRTQAEVPVYYKGKSFTLSLTRGDFERMTRDLMQRTRDTTELCLQQSGVEPENLDEVVLAGGSTNMPVVEQMLVEFCKRKPSRDVIPEEAVARGAAIHAAILEDRHDAAKSRFSMQVRKSLRSISVADVVKHSLGVKVTDPNEKTRKINHILIPRNTQLPCSVTHRLATNAEGQSQMHVEILEGDSPDPAGCELIGGVRIHDLPPGLPKGSPVEVTYSYSAQGRLHVNARELTQGHYATAVIDYYEQNQLPRDSLRDFQSMLAGISVD